MAKGIVIEVSVFIDNALLKIVATTETCEGWKIKKKNLSITLDGVNNLLYEIRLHEF
jgi:hypothetical protein